MRGLSKEVLTPGHVGCYIDGLMRDTNVRFTMVMPPELAKAVLEWRRVQPDVPDRNEAIRRLLWKALGSDDQVVACG